MIKHKLPSGRQADLAKIHLALKQLGMTDAEHRRRLMLSFGKDSSAGLSDAERKRYLADLRKLGFKPKPKARTKIDRTQDLAPQIQKARAIWLMLHNIGVVRDPSESAMVAWGKRQGKVDAMQWQQSPDLLIEALKKWAMRHLPQWIAAQPRFQQALLQVSGLQIVEVAQKFPNDLFMQHVAHMMICTPSARFEYASLVWSGLTPGVKNVSR